MRIVVMRLFSVFMLMMPYMATAQDAVIDADTLDDSSSEETAAAANSKPYEIVINPTFTRMHLRDLIDSVEEDYFARFNELNIDENYDIVCYKHTPIMSHISERVCEPLFLWRARAENSSDVTFLLGSSGRANQARSSANILTPIVLRKNKKKDFAVLQQKMEELNASDEELRSIGSVLAQLKARLAGFSQDD